MACPLGFGNEHEQGPDSANGKLYWAEGDDEDWFKRKSGGPPLPPRPKRKDAPRGSGLFKSHWAIVGIMFVGGFVVWVTVHGLRLQFDPAFRAASGLDFDVSAHHDF